MWCGWKMTGLEEAVGEHGGDEKKRIGEFERIDISVSGCVKSSGVPIDPLALVKLCVGESRNRSGMLGGCAGRSCASATSALRQPRHVNVDVCKYIMTAACSRDYGYS